jgi:hypothetical protein
MAKKVEKEREILKRRLRGHRKSIAEMSNKHYETVRTTINDYVATGKWKVLAVRDAIYTHLTNLDQIKKQQDDQMNEKEIALRKLIK